MNIDLINYLTDRVVRDEVQSEEALSHSIEEALKDRLNEAVKLVQDYDVNKPFADVLKIAVKLNQTNRKQNG